MYPPFPFILYPYLIGDIREGEEAAVPAVHGAEERQQPAVHTVGAPEGHFHLVYRGWGLGWWCV